MIIVNTDPQINGGITQVNLRLNNHLNIDKYIIISNKKPNFILKNLIWIKSYGPSPFILFNFFKFFYLIFKNKTKNKTSIILSDPQFSLISIILIFFKIFHNFNVFFISHGFLFHNKKFIFFKKIYFNLFIFFSKFFIVIAVSKNDELILKNYKKKNFVTILNGIDKLKESKIKKYKFCLIGRNVKSKKINEYLDFINHYYNKKRTKKKSILITDTLKVPIENKNMKVFFNLNRSKLNFIISRTEYIMSFSEYEGFGLALLEGISGGCIPICKNNISFNSILKKFRFLMFKDSNNKKIFNKIVKIDKLKSKDKEKLKQNLKKLVEFYSIEKMIYNYKKILK